MNPISFLLLALTFPVQQPEYTRWEYPADSGTSYGEVAAGKAGNFHCYETVTKASPEKVVLWYAKQLGLKEDHSLVKDANAGFRQIENKTTGSFVIVRGTDDEQLGAVIEWTLTSESAHVHIVVRPDNDATKDVSISLVQVPSGTSISVIQSAPDQR